MKPSDQLLLQQFVRTRSDEAFDLLVHRHGGLVRDSILRRVRDPALADDATQAVFLVLAQKAPTLTERPALGGWLLKTASFAAIDALRRQSTHARHERQAARPEATPSTEPTSENDPRLAALDDAMTSLASSDREALVLRFYQDESFADIAIALGTTEDGARKRTNRALEKLRKLMRRRGTEMSAAALTGLLGIKVKAVAAMPAASLLMHVNTLAATSRGVSISKGVVLMAVNAKLKLLAAVAASVAVLATVGGVLYTSSKSAPTETPQVTSETPAPAPQQDIVAAGTPASGSPANTNPTTTFNITEDDIKAALPKAMLDAHGNLAENVTIIGKPGDPNQLVIKGGDGATSSFVIVKGGPGKDASGSGSVVFRTQLAPATAPAAGTEKLP